MEQAVSSWAFEAIGTHWQVSLYEAIDAPALARIQRAVAARIEQFDAVYSRFRADSLITKISQNAGTYKFPPDSTALFDFYKRLYDVSDGAVTPLIGQTLSDAGYDAAYSLHAKSTIHKPVSWEAAMSFADGTLTAQQPVLLDFGAAGKGYLVDILAALLEDMRVTKFCIDASGDMVVRGMEDRLAVGLEHPADPEQVIGVVTLKDGAICGSAGNRRAWPGYTHILDPQTLRSPRHIAATWCIAADAMTADGLATALYFAPPARLRQQFSFEYCIVYADGTAEYSEQFKVGIFSESDKVAA